MSAAPALLPAEVAPEGPDRVAERPRLRLVPARRRRLGRAGFGVFIGALLAAGLLAGLLLNTALAQSAFTINALEQRARELQIQQQAQEQRVAALDTPESLGRMARELGMVQADTPSFLRLPDGRVTGPLTRVERPPVEAAPVVPDIPVDGAAQSSGDGAQVASEVAAEPAADPATEGDGAVEVAP